MPERPVTVMRCEACGSLDPGPRDLCARCLGRLGPAEVPGRGRLVSWTVIRRPPLAFKDEKSYAVAVVALDAGCQITGRLKDPAATLVPGARVTAVGTQGSVPVFMELAEG